MASPPDHIRVLLADDHSILRSGLRALLSAEPDIEVVGEAANGKQAVDMVRELRPDVVVLDISMPEMDGIEAARHIAKDVPSCRILILTMHKQAHYLLTALKIGASGYVLKSDADTELVQAIRLAHQGEAFFYSADTHAFFRAYLEKGGPPAPTEALSEMERQVLVLTAEGRSNREIGELLHISPRTVDTYRARIMRKLGLHGRAEMHQWALQHGLLTL